MLKIVECFFRGTINKKVFEIDINDLVGGESDAVEVRRDPC